MEDNNKPTIHVSHEKPRSYGSMSVEEYIAERVNPFLEWYDKKAKRFKRFYLWMRSITVLGGAIVPVLINLQIKNIEIATTLISVLVIVFISLESVFHFREQWKNYRSTYQQISSEYFNFVTADGIYRELDNQEAFLNFVERVENAISAESTTTLNVLTTVTNKKVIGQTQK
ncbi:hypothetical protein MNBD_GAMMA22-1274 [hydrothermal vent metagenome]|uniref:DUF4231 domain-containing protein n=1 Tax=hydrothermal vent metagenome TaxID=652676 RepID=A0A3B1A8W1_9ZZZZ